MISYLLICNTVIATLAAGNTQEVNEQRNHKMMKFPSPDLHDFKDLLLQHDVFVDKSSLIKLFLNVSETGPIVINQPIGWGKSLNLDMIRRFFQLEVNEEGVELPDDQKINKKLFLGGQVSVGNRNKVLQTLDIANHPDIVEKYQGKFPVIMLSLKNIFHVDYNKMRTAVVERVMNLFSTEYPYLKKYYTDDHYAIANLSKTEIRMYFDNKTSADSNLDKALYTLSYLLKVHFKQKVIVLIDDYDESVHLAAQKFPKDVWKFTKYLNITANMLGALLKANDNVERSCMTGVFPFNNFGSVLDNLNHYIIPHKDFSQFYGFTENEVETLLNNVPTTVTKLEHMKSWYNGFYYGGQPLYNPSSVLQCLKNGGKLQRYVPYRLDFIENETISENDFELGLHRFFTNNSRFFYYALYPTEDEVTTRQPTQNMYYYLLFGGYVTLQEGDDIAYMYLSIPNHEVTRMYVKIQLHWTTRVFKFPTNWQVDAAALLSSYKMREFGVELQRIANTTDILGRLNSRKFPEQKLHYNGLLMSLAYSVPPDFAYFGQTDAEFVCKVGLLFVPSITSDSKSGIVVEYDIISRKNASLVEYAESAAKNINVSMYESDLIRLNHLDNIYKLFVVFRKGEIAVGYHKLPIRTNETEKFVN